MSGFQSVRRRNTWASALPWPRQPGSTIDCCYGPGQMKGSLERFAEEPRLCNEVQQLYHAIEEKSTEDEMDDINIG